MRGSLRRTPDPPVPTCLAPAIPSTGLAHHRSSDFSERARPRKRSASPPPMVSTCPCTSIKVVMPQRWRFAMPPPTATQTTSLSPWTMTGLCSRSRHPRPRAPSALRPKAATRPSASTTAECAAHALMATAPSTPSTRRGTSSASSLPFPSFPSAPLPQLHTCPSPVIASVWLAPALTAAIFGRFSMRVGTSESSLAPRPSKDPPTPLPHMRTPPSAASSTVCSKLAETAAMRASAAAPERISRGRSSLSREPCPSFPKLPFPHEKARPSAPSNTV
mmetsp:Transcript_29618/g.96472  ORF Transcript_29618/g.96472 Transcript_29618/m.96472 type:complete len:276 (-) Transcript_29618:833-1660(-)